MFVATWNFLSKSLYDFEKAYVKELAPLKFGGFNAWQIVKVPLYFNNIHPGAGTNSVTSKTNVFDRSFKRIARLISFIGSLSLLVLHSVFRRRRPVLFFTFSGDKLARDEQGQYFNFLTDGFIINKIVKNYLYAETSLNGVFKQPSKVRLHFKVDLLYMLFPFFKARARKEVLEASKCINVLHEKLDEFSAGNSCLKTDKQVLQNIFLAFAAERRMFSFLLNICRPQLIITSEKPGTSFLAAAKDMNIPTLDIQHGLIDRHHPQYIYSRELEPFKKDMILPQWLGLFGNFHKKVLMDTGFWKENELAVLGSSRMDMNREKYKNNDAPQHFILVPSQWTYYSQTCFFLENILPALPAGFKVVLKLHPLEKEEQVQAYYKIKEQKPEFNLSISGRNEDIYPLISAARLVIGFDSAVLLEAISLGTPCITLCTDEWPEGIHSLFSDSKLQRSIRPVHLSSKKELLSVIDKGLMDEQYYSEWKNAVLEDGADLFATNYFSNCASFIHGHYKTRS